MDRPPESLIVRLDEETLYNVRKGINLDQPGRMEEAVNILAEWARKQTHFTKKEFSPRYLETTIIACKGSLERAKKQLDKLCTFRTLLPDFFGRFDVKKDVGHLYDNVLPVLLPKLTPDYYRVYNVKIFNRPMEAPQLMTFLKFAVVVGEYLKLHDYFTGLIVFGDFREANIMDLVTKINPVYLRQGLSIFIEAFGIRLKGIHILTPSKLIDTFMILLRQVLSEKIANRIIIHKTIDTVYDYIPKDILPSDFGGNERSLREIHDSWLNLLTSKEHLDFLEEAQNVKTDESLRQTDEFNGLYAGMPGTFRVLKLD